MTERICGRCGNKIGRAELWGIEKGVPFHQVCPDSPKSAEGTSRDRTREAVELKIRDTLTRSIGLELIGASATPQVLTVSFRSKHGVVDVPIRDPNWHVWSVAHLAEEAVPRGLYMVRPVVEGPREK